ncbi:MAG: GxxExxY protein [Chloroflexota bacterium]
MSEYQHFELTKEIIGTFYDVYNALGYGFLEKSMKMLALSLVLVAFKLSSKSRFQFNIAKSYRGIFCGHPCQ